MDTGYLTQQVGAIVDQLHGLFDEIGVPTHEREAREAEVRVYHPRINNDKMGLLTRDAVTAVCSAFGCVAQPGPRRGRREEDDGG